MDYKKEYEDIVQRVKELHESGELTGHQMDVLCPGAAESEDERIRKDLVTFICEFAPEHLKAKYVAYLEKQKDERELSFIEGKLEGVRQTCQEIKDAMSLFEPKDLTPFESTFRDYIDSAIRYCLAGEGYQQYIKEWAADLLNIEKQKEQKPAVEQLGGTFNSYDMAKTFAEGQYYVMEHPEKFGLCKHSEWSEEDKEMLEKCISHMINIIPVPGKHGLKDMSFEKHTDEELVIWLKSLPERFNLQPKQEWSEEDEYKVDVICKLIEHATIIPRSGDDDTGIPPTRLNDKYKGELKAFVKSLRPQPNQEWSEEEKDMLNKIYKCIGWAMDEHAFFTTKRLIGDKEGVELQDFLRSIAKPQNHWKPSEEQIYSLGTVVKGVGENSAGSIAYNLKELYEELKKL